MVVVLLGERRWRGPCGEASSSAKSSALALEPSAAIVTITSTQITYYTLEEARKAPEKALVPSSRHVVWYGASYRPRRQATRLHWPFGGLRHRSQMQFGLSSPRKIPQQLWQAARRAVVNRAGQTTHQSRLAHPRQACSRPRPTGLSHHEGRYGYLLEALTL